MTTVRLDLDWLFDEQPVTDPRFLSNLKILKIKVIEVSNVDIGDEIDYIILEGPLLSFDIFQQMYYDNGLDFEDFIETFKI